jgi:UPF0176 protein
MEGCCSESCVGIIHLPEEDQKAYRRGVSNGNKIFKKGKSDVLTFRNAAAGSSKISNPTAIKKPEKVAKIKKSYIGKATHFFVKASIGQFLVEEGEVKMGDRILIKGRTTGNQELVVGEIFVNDNVSEIAKAGDTFSLKLPFRIRLSDKLYLLG